MHRRTKYLLAALFIFAAEVLIATVLSNVTFIRGSIGDFLVVPFIYCLVRAIAPLRSASVAVGVFLFACLIETAQYFQLAVALHLKKGSLPYVLLGNTFSLMDIMMYFLGAIAAYTIDRQSVRANNWIPH